MLEQAKEIISKINNLEHGLKVAPVIMLEFKQLFQNLDLVVKDAINTNDLNSNGYNDYLIDLGDYVLRVQKDNDIEESVIFDLDDIENDITYRFSYCHGLKQIYCTRFENHNTSVVTIPFYNYTVRKESYPNI